MPKNKPHKGLLKRVRVTRTGKVKLSRAFGRHLRSHKSGKLLRKYRLPKYAAGADAARIRRLLGLPVPSAGRADAEPERTTKASAAPESTPRSEPRSKPRAAGGKTAKTSSKPKTSKKAPAKTTRKESPKAKG